MSQSIIVFQDETILIAQGREGKSPSFTTLERIPLQGYGEPFGRWKTALELALSGRTLENVRLVLPAAMSSARVMQLPFAKGRQLTEMVKKELQDSYRQEIADYSLIRGNKREGLTFLSGGAEEGVLKHFKEICDELKLPVKGITVPMEGYMRLMEQNDLYKGSTAIFLFFEEGSVTSLLYRRGAYLYSSRNRLFGEPGTLDFGTEIVRNISGILQFYSAKSAEEPITHVYYAGCPAEDFEVSVEGISALSLKVEPMAVSQALEIPGERAADWLPCIGAMISGVHGRKDINLSAAALNSAQTEEARARLWGHFLPAAVSLLFSLLVLGGVSLWNLGTLAKLGEVQDWMEEPQIVKAYGEAESLQQEKRALEESLKLVEQTGQSLATYPDMDGTFFARLNEAGGNSMETGIQSFNAETGTLTFTAESQQVIDIPAYVRRLQDTGLFQAVDYTGYAYEDGWYSLALSGALKGNDVGGGQDED